MFCLNNVRLLSALISSALVWHMSSTQNHVNSQDFRVRVIAITGQQAPGMEPGTKFFDDSFGSTGGVAARIDRAGNVAVNAFATGPGISRDTNGEGLWSTSNGPLSLIVRQGDPAPETEAGVTFNRFDNFFQPVPPKISGGFVSFHSILRGPGIGGGNSEGIWSNASGTLSKVVRTGDPCPGLQDGSVFTAFNHISQPSGHVALNATFGAFGEIPGIDPNKEGFWSNTSGTLQLIAAGGNLAPGTTTAVRFGQGGIFAVRGAFREWAFNSSRVVFHANLTGSNIHDLNDEGIWIQSDIGPRLIVREGDPAPGFGPGVHFGAVTGIDAFGASAGLIVSSTGATVFDATVSGGGIDFASALYTTRGTGEAQLLARGGFLQLAVNDFDRVAFNGGLVGSEFGIWSDRTGSLVQIAAKGSQVPGLPSGIVYGNPNSFSNDFLLTGLAASGHVSFVARLSGPGVDSSNNAALFVSDPRGETRVVIRAGDQFDVSQNGTDIRRVFDLRTNSINNQGEIVATLFFSDGTKGVFTFCDALCQNPTPTPPSLPLTPPPGTHIFLSATARTVKGRNLVDLAWHGAYEANMVLLRNGVQILRTDNDGTEIDILNKLDKRGSVTYKICEEKTFICSSDAVVSF